MSRQIAGQILETAAKTVMTERGTQHGDAENSFRMIGEMWMAYLRNTWKRRAATGSEIKDLTIEPVDVANMMVQLKQARSVYGDGTNLDHYVDAAGYTALAGMLTVEAQKEKAGE